MRIGLNLLYLIPGLVGGSETYAAGLLRGLATVSEGNEFVVFVNREGAHWPLPDSIRFTRVVCPVRAASRLRRYSYEQLLLSQLLDRLGVELLHSLGYVMPLRTRRPAVVSILDLNYLAVPESVPWPRRLALGFFVQQSARRADHVITISEFVRQELIRDLGISGAKITPILLAGPEGEPPGEPPAPAGWADGGPYMIAFSSQFPHKNIPRLIRAFAIARERRGLRHRLLVVGHRPPGETAGERDGAIFTGFLEQPELARAWSGAEALVFPSLYEGFGLPVLEAMARDIPVLSSDRASLPEVAGDAAIYFDPDSTEDIVNKLVAVASDAPLRQELARKGRRNLERFSWAKTAAETLDVYRTVLGGLRT